MSRVLRELVRPIIAAPMAGGPSTPELVAAVGAAGGLGFVPAGYLRADRLAAAIKDVRDHGVTNFGVNVFVPGDPAADAAALESYARRLAGDADRLGVALGEPAYDDDDYAAKLAVLGELRVPVVSFTFGLPGEAVVDELHAGGSEVWVTITDPATAPDAARIGADALVVQGMEAGAHRGGPGDTADAAAAEAYALLPLLRLVAARTSTPMVATGGIADGASVAAVLAAGAAAAQLGTAFLGCPEAGTSGPHRDALGTARPTRLTRAFTGRWARGIVNRFLLAHDAAAPAAYPQVHHLTAPLRAAARGSGDAEALHLWAGQAHALTRRLPAAGLIEQIMAEADAAVRAAAGVLAAHSPDRPGSP
ncbi:MAG TPA: nitronate monooxygenase [Streptosporangiaceae bacterium]|nr:nitronate monooxygenase [Streptosporangiaceae bacterium]